MRLYKVYLHIKRFLKILQVEKKIRGRVKQQMEKSQREYYLNEQMKAIQKELGEIGDEGNDLESLLNKIKSTGLNAEAEEKVIAENKDTDKVSLRS